MKLMPNQTTTVQVKANEFHPHTGIEVEAGELYTFACDPDDTWIDMVVRTNADGFDPKDRFPLLTFPDPVLPGVNYFCLCARIEQDGTEPELFAIGVKKESYTAPFAGQITFFANDAPRAYWNNLGKIAVQVTRLS